MVDIGRLYPGVRRREERALERIGLISERSERRAQALALLKRLADERQAREDRIWKMRVQGRRRRIVR